MEVCITTLMFASPSHLGAFFFQIQPFKEPIIDMNNIQVPVIGSLYCTTVAEWHTPCKLCWYAAMQSMFSFWPITKSQQFVCSGSFQGWFSKSLCHFCLWWEHSSGQSVCTTCRDLFRRWTIHGSFQSTCSIHSRRIHGDRRGAIAKTSKGKYLQQIPVVGYLWFQSSPVFVD